MQSILEGPSVVGWAIDATQNLGLFDRVLANVSKTNQLLSCPEPKLRTEAGHSMPSYQSSEILITVLRSTSFLLEHYGYSGHDPSLGELQRSLGRAMEQLAAHTQIACGSPNAFESQ